MLINILNRPARKIWKVKVSLQNKDDPSASLMHDKLLFSSVFFWIVEIKLENYIVFIGGF